MGAREGTVKARSSKKQTNKDLAAGSMKDEPVEDPPVVEERSAKTFYLSVSLQRRVRNAVLAMGGAPEYLTLSRFVENAMEAELERLSVKYNQGKEFPAPADPERKIRTGRPLIRR
jgi:hypothetical protein